MYDHLYQLELSLLTSSVRKSPEALCQLLAEEFIEFGSSGKIYNKQIILAALPLEASINRTIEDFNVTALSESAMLATYKAVTNGAISLRSSIWKNNADRWQMVFHQGTLIK